MRQTAVEWLAEQMLWNEFHNPYLEKAKEIEKEQMRECYENVFFNDTGNELNFEHYYNETYAEK